MINYGIIYYWISGCCCGHGNNGFCYLFILGILGFLYLIVMICLIFVLFFYYYMLIVAILYLISALIFNIQYSISYLNNHITLITSTIYQPIKITEIDNPVNCFFDFQKLLKLCYKRIAMLMH